MLSEDDRDLIEKALKKKLVSFERMARDVEADEDEVSGDFGPFDIIGPIKRGGTGMVYLAWDGMSNRKVALKILTRTRDDTIKRLYREVNLSLKLMHPNIVRVYGVGQIGDRHYISMQYIDGHTLAEVQYPLPQALPIVVTVARALQYAHDQGIIHRDIKPSNILIDRNGVPYLGDFGLAKDVESTLDPSITISLQGIVIGTPSFMSPEQAEGNHRLVDRQSDVYSLGATLYQMVTNRLPFTGRSPMDIVARVATEAPVPPRFVVPGCPVEVERVILRAMEKNRRRRYRTAAEFAADVEAIVEGRPSRFVSMSARRPLRRSTTAGALAVLFVVLLVGAVFTARAVWRSYSKQPAESAAKDLNTARAQISNAQYEAAHATLEPMTSAAARYWLGVVDVRLAALDSARRLMTGIDLPERSPEADRAFREFRTHFSEVTSRRELQEYEFAVARVLSEGPATIADLWNQLRSIDVSSPELQRLKGDVALLARSPEAIGCYDRALLMLGDRLSAADVEMYYLRALARLRRHLEESDARELQLAMVDFTTFLGLSGRFDAHPGRVEGFVLRGFACRLDHDPAQQKIDWSTARRMNPKYEPVLR